MGQGTSGSAGRSGQDGTGSDMVGRGGTGWDGVKWGEIGWDGQVGSGRKDGLDRSG